MTRDLMHSAEIKQLVRDAYRDVPPTTEAVARKFYSAEELATVPASAISRALGVANHLRFADITFGETVLDLGCGGGIDTILAARRTGPTGRVIALDFLPEMIERTTAAVREARLSNVEPLHGEMEAIPLPDDSVDLIISNGVINLSARKSRVMAESARVFRPNGQLCVSDLTVEQDDLPPEILTQPTAWAGCVAGALAEGDFARKLEKAGFSDVEVVQREPLSIDDCALGDAPARRLSLRRPAAGRRPRRDGPRLRRRGTHLRPRPAGRRRRGGPRRVDPAGAGHPGAHDRAPVVPAARRAPRGGGVHRRVSDRRRGGAYRPGQPKRTVESARAQYGHGERAATAASLLEQAGRTELSILDGGPHDWSAATGLALVGNR